ncbi:alpha/beta fold hydrolase [Gordonia amicalis]|uniref:Alpha/beta hydrolase n=1 Tax=Gordonia amicalis TaxID=89053 RepID=A0AAE4U8L8_9ACTN|nr:alpha/beta hydrolase [Gordonia amicalis]MCZ4578624.1 alpha/beta hydrolase [Gordonia amicalis]MDV6311463.1 alpha/beta hydrolase [Gordonia amicalis]
MTEFTLDIGGRLIAVREAGESSGPTVVHFHGTPGSRLEAAFGDQIAQRAGIRVVSFDRPGYGGSDPAPIGLTPVARDAEALADHLGLDRFAVFGWSGGGPFALAAAALMPDRVTCVGVSGGPGPALDVPGARELLTDNDRLALSHLPADPARAAEVFLAGNRDMLDAMMSVRTDPTAPWIDWMWGTSDAAVIADPSARQTLFESFSEAMKRGPGAIAWDNVAFVGPWDFRLADVSASVCLWYGADDAMAVPATGEWLAGHLPDAELTVLPGEGHLLPFRHWDAMLSTLIDG